MTKTHFWLVWATLPLLPGCDLDTELAPRVDVDLVVRTSESTFTTDDDTTIELTEVRMALDTVEFTTEGEMHARAGVLSELLVPTAFAHPGHSAGGEVVGELVGRHVVDFLDGNSTVGIATLLSADYSGANFMFTRAVAADGLDGDDPLIGHTFVIGGTATRGETTVEFFAQVDQDADRAIIGLPLSYAVTPSSTESLGLRFDAVDPIEGDSIFEGIDIVGLDTDGDGFVELSDDAQPEAWATLRRNLQVHDHYAVEVVR